MHAHTQQEAHLSAGNGAQIIGKVNPDLSIKVLSSMDLGTEVGESNPHRASSRPLSPLLSPPLLSLSTYPLSSSSPIETGE